MIKVIEEKPVPKGKVICRNCGSVLEYGNADLYRDYEYDEYNISIAQKIKHYHIICPVCGCETPASWV